MTAVDLVALETKVKETYRLVAEQPYGTYHFEMGRSLAERLGYDGDLLDRVPRGAVDSFAGVGYVFGLAQLADGERVIDLGSGSGMDACYAAQLVGPHGRVVGVDFTPQQLDRARGLAAEAGLGRVEFREGRIESIPADAGTFDCGISNGVINLSADKARVFAEAARVLRPGGRLAIADIVTERPLKDSIVRDADLWAACIGGAAQQDEFVSAVESAGLTVTAMWRNPYEFISRRARDASATYGVKSISVLAVKTSG
ncbi:methyltransferase domain-containing protein [Kribbella turkmenica]|uniref:Arsenite methyltransferase n=1 Tax=Kribbella turkmenica TaxID=2530375 RepID=A0A4R4X796_9ACTN|nr:methyltransferase domain-containing protein [Kribbella turkmenica]TDD26300.1 methyltransferase domain-containing protein [Kribbella turkmenica]